MEDLVNFEIERMKFNAFKVFHEVADRINGVASSGYMKGYATCGIEDLYFGTQNTLKVIFLIKIKIKRLCLGITFTKNFNDF